MQMFRDRENRSCLVEALPACAMACSFDSNVCAGSIPAEFVEYASVVVKADMTAVQRKT